jgi:molybdate transport system ATP-binding protein
MDLKSQFSISFSSSLTISADFKLALGKFNIIVLFGPSGCGKTTLLRCLAGLIKPDSGFISVDNEAWFCSKQNYLLPACKRGIGYVFQNSALFPHLNVEQNIAYGIHHWPRSERKARVLELIDLMGLNCLAFRKPSEISGGQRQRVALARALAPKPQLVLMDEPFVSLDQAAANRLRHHLRQMLKKMNVPAILVTHDRQEALTLGDRVLLMSNGHIIQDGIPSEVLSL